MEVIKRNAEIKQRPRVGVYVRVSTRKDEQEYSFAFQSKYWIERFENDSSVEFVGLFTDEGISGKSMRNRKGLQKLLDMARNGKVDKIYTKSISRFARNYTETLDVVRELRDIGIPLIFEKENINTLDPKCGLILTVMASLAEQEIISMSNNQKWAARKRFANGSIELSRIYGYTYSQGNLTVKDDEAEVVRLIFEYYLEGYGVEKIAKMLTQEGYKNIHGITEWNKRTVLYMLKNEKYAGNALLQKSVYTLKNKVKNNGIVPQYYIENSHEPIVSTEIFEAVQKLIRERAVKYHHTDANAGERKYPFTGKIKCGICGATYKRKIVAKGKTYECIKWACTIKEYKGKAVCASHDIKNDVLEKLFLEAYNECLDKNFEYPGVKEEYDRLKVLLKTEQELKALRVKGYISDEMYRNETEKVINEIKCREATIQSLQSKKLSDKKFVKSDVLQGDMADFLIKATVVDWTITFEFANGCKITKSYTNGRSGNVNGKLCKHKA